MEFEVSPEEVVMDVSDHFWPFVDALIETNGADELRTHDSYAFFGGIIEFSVSIRGDALLCVEEVQAESPAVYTFENFNYLFYNARTILRRHHKFGLAQKVQKALDIMCIQIEMEESMADLSL
jgi:hypothetical protein